MFVHIRYQTGEIDQVIEEMKKGSIPCMDVDNYDEYNWVIGQLENKGMFKIPEFSHDIDARDRVKEPEFEFRDAFYTSPAFEAGSLDKSKLLYIDFYFEPVEDETYDSIGEM